MNNTILIMSMMALFCAAGPTWAQQQAAPAAVGPAAPSTSPKPPPGTAQSEAGDPQADTSSATAAGPAPAPAPPAAPTPPAGRPGARAPAGQKSAPRTDRLDLGTATVTGDREQPKVMYVVPWKRSDIGDLEGKPMNSLVDEILAPVDRDVFKREVVYYHAVHTDTSQNGAPPQPGRQGEK